MNPAPEHSKHSFLPYLPHFTSTEKLTEHTTRNISSSLGATKHSRASASISGSCLSRGSLGNNCLLTKPGCVSLWGSQAHRDQQEISRHHNPCMNQRQTCSFRYAVTRTSFSAARRCDLTTRRLLPRLKLRKEKKKTVAFTGMQFYKLRCSGYEVVTNGLLRLT